jgi:hypothetical protein
MIPSAPKGSEKEKAPSEITEGAQLGCDLCRHRDVGVDKAGGAAGIVNHFDGALGAFLHIVGDHHARTFLCEFQRRGPANTRPTAGHQHNFVLNKP